MNKLITYVRDSVGEMKKVTWPTKKQVINYSIVVIALSLGVAIFFGILDYILNWGLTQII